MDVEEASLQDSRGASDDRFESSSSADLTTLLRRDAKLFIVWSCVNMVVVLGFLLLGILHRDKNMRSFSFRTCFWFLAASLSGPVDCDTRKLQNTTTKTSNLKL